MHAHGRGIPGASVAVLLKRHKDENFYPVVIEFDGEIARFLPNNADTAVVGYGEIEVQAFVGEMLKKSAKGMTRVAPSMTGQQTEPPEPQRHWVQKVLQASAEANNAVLGLQTDVAELEDDIARRHAKRITPLNSASIVTGGVVDVVGIPEYVGDDKLSGYGAYGLTETGWYTFTRVTAPDGVKVGSGFAVSGAHAKNTSDGNSYVDIAVRFGAAPESQEVTIRWETGIEETYVFRAVDLAVRNLDSRATYYVYDIAEFATYTWKLTTDAAFVAGTRYYTKDGDRYTLAEVETGAAVPAGTYYVHASVTFEGMPRNLSYMMDIIDCPVTMVMPVIEDDNYGAWIEIQARYTAAFSVTLRVPEGVKMSAKGTQTTAKGVNIMTVQYFGTDKMWRLDNTKWEEPT